MGDTLANARQKSLYKLCLVVVNGCLSSSHHVLIGHKGSEGGRGQATGQGSRKGLFCLSFPKSLLPADIFLHINGQNCVSWPLFPVKVVEKANSWLFKFLLRLWAGKKVLLCHNN